MMGESNAKREALKPPFSAKKIYTRSYQPQVRYL
jgi:hypothetical protein